MASRPVEEPRLSAIILLAPTLAASMVAKFLSRWDGGNSCRSFAAGSAAKLPAPPPDRKPASSRSCRVTEVSSTRAPGESRWEEETVVVPDPAARWDELLL